jgi:hypothetical protein
VSESERLRLARLARDTALAVPGVQATDGGPLGLIGTLAGDERVLGVTCTPVADGGYDVTLRLVCALAPLPALAAQVRETVLRVATGAGLSVSELKVHVTDLAA